MGSFISALYNLICCCKINDDIDDQPVEKENSNSASQTDRPVTPHPQSKSLESVFEPRNFNTLSPVKEPEPQHGNTCSLGNECVTNTYFSQDRYKHFVDESNPDELEILTDDEKCCDANECCENKECCNEDNICCTENGECCNNNENLKDSEKCCDANECCENKECCDEDNICCTRKQRML